MSKAKPETSSVNNCEDCFRYWRGPQPAWGYCGFIIGEIASSRRGDEINHDKAMVNKNHSCEKWSDGSEYEQS